LVWVPPWYPTSPVESMNRAPLAATCASTPAWFTLRVPSSIPLLVVSPQSPKTPKVKGALLPGASNVVNRGDALAPSRSVWLASPV